MDLPAEIRNEVYQQILDGSGSTLYIPETFR
jgi:hypothetical protein